VISYDYMASPVGQLMLVSEGHCIRKIVFRNNPRAAEPDPAWRQDADALGEVMRQLQAYFAGTRESFDLQLAPEGTPFQKKVWTELGKIPYGDTLSYGELAKRIGNPKASRAVGLANGANPIPIIVPCHRVIGANGKLTGYGGGLPIKEKLLALERRQLQLL
jgi:methylated-DNA-[protein]-cysteine S-methyltransferase